MTTNSHAAGVSRPSCLDGEAASAGAVEPRGNAACEAVTEHIWAWPHEVEQRLAEGWRIADAWHRAAHHLKWTLPMFRSIGEHEEWAPVIGFAGYEVSSWGRVRSLPRRVFTKSKHGTEGTRIFPGKLMIQTKRPNGYMAIGLSTGGTVSHFYIHRLVAEAFVHGRDNQRREINHKNGIKIDNHFMNLEWVDRKSNVRHLFDVLGFKFSEERTRKIQATRARNKLLPVEDGDA